MEQKFCQSCGMPLNPEVLGTEKDGSKNEEYCTYCYADGHFTVECTMDEMINQCAQFVDEFNKGSEVKMTKEEVKQEHKESDGNPHIKGRIRQKQREIADRASVSAVPKADFVVMNPTHYAVALKYDEKTMSAPQVISRGTDLIAMKIRDVAKEHNVPVLQSPMLARALYAHAELDQAIPATLYTAVAQVLAYVYRLKAALRGEGRMPDSLVEPFVPPELDPLNRTTVQGAAV